MSSKHFHHSDIMAMDQRYRTAFINSLSGFKSANLVGTQNQAGRTNLALVSSVVHIGANPPYLGMIMRPHTVRRDTIENIESTGVYTLNHVAESFYPQAHQTSARYDEFTSEFDATGLTPVHIDSFTAPFVEQSPIKLGMTLKEILPISCNNTQLIIGEVTHVILNEQAVGSDGFVDLEALKVMAISSLDSYHVTQQQGRMAYAKPELPPRINTPSR